MSLHYLVKHEWPKNQRNVSFSVIRVSQGSVATYVRCGEMSTEHRIANFMLSLPVKEFLKSVKIWQSYCHPKFGGLVFFGTRCILQYCVMNEWMYSCVEVMMLSSSMYVRVNIALSVDHVTQWWWHLSTLTFIMHISRSHFNCIYLFNVFIHCLLVYWLFTGDKSRDINEYYWMSPCLVLHK